MIMDKLTMNTSITPLKLAFVTDAFMILAVLSSDMSVLDDKQFIKSFEQKSLRKFWLALSCYARTP